MPENLAPLQPGALAALSDVLPPLSNAELFWQARHLDPSAYLEHLPFLFWLITTMRPRTILTLHLTNGVAHFAACQAIEAQGDGGNCLGLRYVSMPETEETLAGRLALEAYGETTYPDISKITAVSQEQALEGVEEDSIDLMIVETPPSDALWHDFEDIWLPKLTVRGVVLLPGPREMDPKKAARLLERFDTIHFPHDRGLTAAMVGNTPPQVLQRLTELVQKGKSRHHVQQFFENIGQINAQKVALRDANKARAAATQRETNNWNWAIRLQSEQKELKEAFDARHETTARVQAELFDSRSEVLQLREQMATGNMQARTYPTDLHDRLAALQADLDARREENAVLQERLEAQHAALKQIEADQAEEILALAATIDMQTREIRDLRERPVPDPVATSAAEQERFEEIAVLTETLEQQQQENARLARALASTGLSA